MKKDPGFLRISSLLAYLPIIIIVLDEVEGISSDEILEISDNGRSILSALLACLSVVSGMERTPPPQKEESLSVGV